METKFSKKPLVITLMAAFIGMLGASPLVLADEGGSMTTAEPAPATEPAADAAPTDATAAPAAEGATTEEATPAEAAPADTGVAPGM